MKSGLGGLNTHKILTPRCKAPFESRLLHKRMEDVFLFSLSALLLVPLLADTRLFALTCLRFSLAQTHLPDRTKRNNFKNFSRRLVPCGYAQ